MVDGPIDDDIEYLFGVGCAGALEDRARKTTKAIATLLHTAGVKFAVLGPAETCTGDPARRIGNEFVFSMLAQQKSSGEAAGTLEVIDVAQILARSIALNRPITRSDMAAD